MMMLAWLSLAKAAETDCVTKDLAWRWLSTSAGDRWVHGSKVVVEQAPGATGRLSWAGDEASKVPFRATPAGEAFKWKVTMTASDGKPIAADVAESKVDLTMHCLRTTGGSPAAAPAPKPAPKPAAAAPVPAPAAPAPAPKPAPAPPAPK